MRQLRLLAAVAVVVGHGYVLNGETPAPRVGGIPLHTLGLYVFFTISGYLITSSWNRWPNLPSFVRNRALRILPALAAVVLLTVVVIGPLATELTLSEYLNTPQTWLYLSGVLLVCSYFALGALACHLRVDRRHFPALLMACLVVGWLLLGEFIAPIATICAWAVVPAAVLTIALRSKNTRSGVDLSYGVYLWGYPIQQLVLQVNPDLPVVYSVALTILFTLAVATLSWHHLEAPALGLKRLVRPRAIPRRQPKSAPCVTTA
ncbi:acyltransferase family protein [Cryobacterium ruanii]|uniref:Acyltransferase n=1 Tax=Cryobacterium ruanii TaxID=1259197 RepID=A0A4R9AMC7_9MICO|nr:acyltransferase family protein [Cryobacterium ruanii]TFD65363.1 acyltransferase [Cryobacterium ruanii]